MDYYRATDEIVIRQWWGDRDLWRTLDNVKPPEISHALWAQFCHCDNRRDGFGYDEKTNEWVHVGCGKVRPHYGAIFLCDNCGEYYKVQKVPDRMLLCPPCIELNS